MNVYVYKKKTKYIHSLYPLILYQVNILFPGRQIPSLLRKMFTGFFLLKFLLAVLGLPCCPGFFLLMESKGNSLVVGRRPLTLVASLLQSMASRALGLPQFGTWAQQLWYMVQLLHSMWNLSRPGVELLSPAFSGRFLTTEPPQKSYKILNEQNCFRIPFTGSTTPSFNSKSHHLVGLVGF